MEKFKATTENAEFIVQAFKTNYANAKSIIKSKYPITDDEFRQLQADFSFDKLTSLLPKKEKVKRFLKDRKELKRDGVFIDNENKAISYPFEKIKPEHEEFIKNLQSIGFTFQSATFLI